MRMRQRLAAVTLIGGLTTLGIGLTAGVAGANVVTDCPGLLGSAQSGSLHVTGTPAAGSSVPVGSSISLDSSWTKSDFTETDRLYVCGTIDGTFNSALSSQNNGVGNDGSLTEASSVPAGAPAGSNVCVLTALVGQLADKSQGTMVSETLCYTAAAAVTTTTMAPTTTTTAAPTVQPTADPVNSNAGTNSAPAVEPAPAVIGEQAATPAPMPVLPRTGSGVDRLAGFGGMALALGGLTRFLGRRRPSEA
jgi:hypothetical protein